MQNKNGQNRRVVGYSAKPVFSIQNVSHLLADKVVLR